MLYHDTNILLLFTDINVVIAYVRIQRFKLNISYLLASDTKNFKVFNTVTNIGNFPLEICQ